MCRDGAEGTAAETAAMDVHRELYHLVCRYALALVLGVRQARVGQVEGGVELLGGHGRVGRIDHYGVVAHVLQQTRGVHLV